MIDIIKRKKMECLILNILIIVVTMSTIVLNSDNYKQIFTEENLITNEKNLDKILSEDKRFVTVDLNDAKLTRLSIKNNSSNKIEVNTYKITFDSKTLIIFLSGNTAITNKVKGELIKPVNEQLEIYDQLKKEYKDENIINVCFSNVDYKLEEKIIKLKFIISVSIIILCILFSFSDIFYFMNPKKTRKYKKYTKKHN